MRPLNALRDELKFVGEFRALFEVIQQVAVAQLRRLDEAVRDQAALATALREQFLPLLPAAARRLRWLRAGRGPRLLVLMTSEEGMVGPLYTEVVRRASALATPQSQWILVGSRGLRALDVPADRVRIMPMPGPEAIAEEMPRLARLLLREYRQRALESVWLVAAQYRSPTQHELATHRLLPLEAPPTAPSEDRDRELVLEPSLGRAVHALAAAWVEAHCREAAWSARRAECAARALHMEGARQQLAEQAEQLRHAFFKAQHERVDVMVRESFVVQRLAAARAEGGR